MADQPIVTTRGAMLKEAVLKESTIQDFHARLRGTLLRPGEDGYDRARVVWNATHPQMGPYHLGVELLGDAPHVWADEHDWP